MEKGLGIGNTIVAGSTMLEEVRQRRAATGSALPPPPEKRVIDSVLDRQPAQGSESTPSQAPAQPPASSPASESNPAIEEMNKKFAALESRYGELDKENKNLKSNFERTQGTLKAYQDQIAQRPMQAPPPPPEIPYPDDLDDDLKAAMHTVEQRALQKTNAVLQQYQQQNNAYQQEQQRALFQSAVDRMRTQKPEFTQYFSDEELANFAAPFIKDPRFMNINWGRELELGFKVKDYDPLQAKYAAALKELEQYKKKDESNKESQKKNLTLVSHGVGAGTSGNSGQPLSAAEKVLGAFRSKGIRPSTKDKMRAVRRELGYA